MHKSSRVNARIRGGWGGGGGGGGGGRGPTARKQSGQRFFSPELFYSFQMGSNIFHAGGGGGG